MFGNATTSLNKIQRLFKIHQMILNNNRPKADEIAKELKCGIRTVYKDIQELYNMGAPLTYEGRYGGYFYSPDAAPWRFPYVDDMLANNLQMLSAAKLLLTYFDNTPFYEEIEKVLNNVCKIQADSPLLSRIALAPTTNTTRPINTTIWSQICNVITKNHVIRFRYQNNHWDPDLEKSSLHVEPYQLLIDEGKSLLFGYLREKKAVRLYDINDMYDIIDTNIPFKLPENYEFKNHTGKSHFGAFTRYAERKYKIAFYEDAVPDVKLGNWADDQEFIDDVDEQGYERTVVTFSSAQDMRVLDWVFKNKAYAKPLAPESIVARWKYNVEKMAEMAGHRIKVDYSLLDKAEKLEREGK